MQDTFSSDAIGPTPIKPLIDPALIDPTYIDPTLESNESKVQVGDTTSFLVKGEVVPVQVSKVFGDFIIVTSLDLLRKWTITKSKWLRQKEILAGLYPDTHNIGSTKVGSTKVGSTNVGSTNVASQ